MICRISLPNSQYGHLLPPEDALDYQDGAIAVADGITRDPCSDMDFTKRSFDDILKDYPNPSGARFAADAFCEAFIENGGNCENTDEIKTRFIEANTKIAGLNQKNIKAVDYLVNDFWGCVAAGAVIANGKLFWGVIGDCGVMIFSKTGKLKLESPNPVALFERFVAEGRVKFKWETTEGRKYVRSQHRNRPDNFIDGICASYGALTGETTAEPFIHTGIEPLSKGDLILVFSDGFEPTVKHPDFFKKVYDTSESVVEQKLIPFNLSLVKADPGKYGKERSLMAVIY